MKYDRAYYTTGNYIDYLQRKFAALAKDLVALLRLEPFHKVIDVGCGYGGLVHELYSNGFHNSYGVDISTWAINYGQEIYPEIAGNLEVYKPDNVSREKDHVLFLDVLEHIAISDLSLILKMAARNLRCSLVARIPISGKEGDRFFLDASNSDPTHITCHCRNWWLSLFDSLGYEFGGDVTADSIYSSQGVLSGIWKPK